MSRQTRSMLDGLEVEFVYNKRLNRAPWFNFSNKIAALEYAQSELATPWLIWLDSDIIFLREPSFTEKLQSSSADFMARCEYLPPAEIEGRDIYAAYWQRIFKLCGVPQDNRPYVDLDFPRVRMKPFFNSGLMLWRRNSGFVESYARNFYRIVGAKLAAKGVGPWFADQVAIPPTVAGLDLKWEMLELRDHLMLFSFHLQDADFRQALSGANLVHYSKSRDIPFRADFDKLILDHSGQIEPIFRMAENLSTSQKVGLVYRMQRTYRRARQSLFARTCTEI